MTPALPEHGVWQEQQAPSPSASVAVRMTPASPFEQAAERMPSPLPVKYQQQPQQHHHLQQAQPFVKPRRSRLVALLNCACCGGGPAVNDSTDVAAPPVASLGSYEADSTGKLAEHAASSKPQLPVGRHLSGHKTWDAVPRRHSQNVTQKLSRADTEYYDAESVCDTEHEQHLATIDSTEELDAIASQLQEQLQRRASGGVPGVSSAEAQLVNSACRAPWIPETPLLFAPPNKSFVPVPAHTGFAGYWENDYERTTPFPQPIDVMLGLNFLVKRAHKSIPGLWLQENDNTMTVTAKPGFLPPGALATYTEVFDKTGLTEPVWGLRRDMSWGTMSGRIYMTSDGTLILRTVSRSVRSKEVENITEDYLTLEDNGQVVVDRMCCMHVASGKRATQYQVGMRREHPPSGWGAPMVPGYRPHRALSIAHSQEVARSLSAQLSQHDQA